MSTPTQKQSLEQAEAKVTELEGKLKASEGLQAKLDDATTKLSAAETARDGHKTRADQAETSLKAATERADKAETDAKAEKARADQLQADSKTTDEKAREQNSRVGLNAHKKADGVVTGAGEDIAAIAEQFTNPATSMTEKASLLAKHGPALNAFAAVQAKKANG